MNQIVCFGDLNLSWEYKITSIRAFIRQTLLVVRLLYLIF